MFVKPCHSSRKYKYSRTTRSRAVQDSVLAGSGNFAGCAHRSFFSSDAVKSNSVYRLPSRFAAFHSFSVNLINVTGDLMSYKLSARVEGIQNLAHDCRG